MKGDILFIIEFKNLINFILIYIYLIQEDRIKEFVLMNRIIIVKK